MSISEVSIDIARSRCRLYRKYGSRIKILSITNNGDRIIHLVTCPKDLVGSIRDEDDLRVLGLNLVDNEASVWCLSKGCDVCKPLVEEGCIILDGYIGQDGSMNITFLSPSDKTTEKIFRIYRELGIEYEVRYTRRYGKGRILTDRQEQVLYLAYKMGFFDFPRKTSLKELSEILGIKEATLSEILRRGVKKVIQEYFK